MNKIFWIFALISAVYCDQLHILNRPKSVNFKGNSVLYGSDLSEILGSTLGYSLKNTVDFDGLEISDPFNLASAVVAVVVEGEDLSVKNAKSFNLVGPSDFDQTLPLKVQEHSHKAVEIDVSANNGESIDGFNGEELTVDADSVKTNFLKPKSNKFDQQFLNQIALINSLTKQFESQIDLPTACIVKVSLKSLEEQHKDDQSALTEAKKLLSDAIGKLNESVKKAYAKQAVFVVVTQEESSESTLRVRRQAKAEKDYNLAPVYDPNYPVIFNIILWFSIILIFTLLAISLAIAGMEDKDSIIYRMTSTRMKKDD